MKLTFCKTHEGLKIEAPKQIRVLIHHPAQGPIEGLFEAEGYGSVYIRISDHLKDQADFVNLRVRVSLGLDPFASYMICSPLSVNFLS